MRVRSMQMNDAHIYCTKEQFEEEFIKVTEMYLKYFEILGIEKYEMRLSLSSPEGMGEKYVGEPELWKETEELVRKAMKKAKVPFEEVEDEAAFYGPKIDIEVWSAIGREFTLATNQVDFAVPKRMDITYTDKDGKDQYPLIIHRAPLSTHERFIGFLIEHFGGAFPTWLAPVQVVAIPVADAHQKYADEILSQLRISGVRVELMSAEESLGKRIRTAETQKIPYMLIIGDKEVDGKSVTVRHHSSKDQATVELSKFIESLLVEIKERKLNQ